MKLRFGMNDITPASRYFISASEMKLRLGIIGYENSFRDGYYWDGCYYAKLIHSIKA